MSRRKMREAQFLSPGGGVSVSMSDGLLSCALSELEQALRDRRGEVVRMPNNHYSHHALGSIVLLMCGFEAWLNEAILHFGFGQQQIKLLVCKPMLEKYYNIPKRIANTTIPTNSDLELIIDIRDEIAHPLPRFIREQGNVPSWFLELQRRGLFIRTSHRRGDFLLSQKLASYRLAYWAWQRVDEAVMDLLRALGSEAELIRWTTSNFGRYRNICPPSKLADYDVK